MLTPALTPHSPPVSDTVRDQQLKEQAKQLEGFLFAELLRVSGAGRSKGLGGGETQFDSFLRAAQAEAVADSGQTGLAEALYRSMRKSLG